MGRDKALLRQLQALPLDAKILLTQQRIREWYNHFNGQVCISFSGGKDSTVLAHIVHEMYPEVPLVFANTGLEYPEIQAFARKMGAEFVRPKMSFSEVISTYGYPIISKEVAEAIHVARKIVRKEPAGANMAEMNTAESPEPLENKNFVGGGIREEENRAQRAEKQRGREYQSADSGTTGQQHPGKIMGGVSKPNRINGTSDAWMETVNPQRNSSGSQGRTDSSSTEQDRYPDYRTEETGRTAHRMELNGEHICGGRAANYQKAKKYLGGYLSKREIRKIRKARKELLGR